MLHEDAQLTKCAYVVKGITGILARNEILASDRYTGACTSGASDSTTFHSNRSYDYAFRCKATLSNTPDAQSSGIFMQHPG